jgi:hypothetical protein
MVMPALTMRAMVAVAGVGATFGLKRGLHVCEIRSKTNEHILDHVVRPNAKDLVSNFSRQMPISQMPRKTSQLAGICMPNFNNELRGCPDL